MNFKWNYDISREMCHRQQWFIVNGFILSGKKSIYLFGILIDFGRECENVAAPIFIHLGFCWMRKARRGSLNSFIVSKREKQTNRRKMPLFRCSSTHLRLQHNDPIAQEFHWLSHALITRYIFSSPAAVSGATPSPFFHFHLHKYIFAVNSITLFG